MGVAIRLIGERRSRYYAWGHASNNNCSWEDGKRIINKVWNSGAPLLFQNAKFDVDVAETFFNVKTLPWDQIHDTMYLIALHNPHLKNLGLKPVAHAILGLAPEERDAIREWLVERKLIQKKASERKVMEMLQLVPGDIVGRYADGDILRTDKLFAYLFPYICTHGMHRAYERERELMPLLLGSERTGMRVDMSRLEQDMVQKWRPALKRVDTYIHKKLGADVNLDSNEELADALEAKGMAEGFLMTPTGLRSVSAESLQGAISDPRMFLALGYRSRLGTCINMFMENWLEIGTANKGSIHTSWTQVRQSGGKENKGARTSRLITQEPNVLNLIKTWKGRGAHGFTEADVAKRLKFLNLPDLPLVRYYILADRYGRSDGVWCHRDYNQQELRILGHFEDGALMQAYLDNPWLDVHDFVKLKVEEILRIFTNREHIKTINFGMIYGEGMGSLAEKMHVTVELCKQLREAQLTALPGLKGLDKGIKKAGMDGDPIVTWGGREYYAEEPRIINGYTQRFEYKLLNYLIQGSAADITKEAVIRYHHAKRDGRFLVTVYDEINISAPRGAVKQEMSILREIMEGIELDVPLLSDGKIGDSWGGSTYAKTSYQEPKFDIDAWKERMAA